MTVNVDIAKQKLLHSLGLLLLVRSEVRVIPLSFRISISSRVHHFHFT